MKKRIISLFLALVMLFSCLSLNVFATDAEGGTEAGSTDAPKAGDIAESTLEAHTDSLINQLVAKNGSHYTFLNGKQWYNYTLTSGNVKTDNSFRFNVTGDGRYVNGAIKNIPPLHNGLVDGGGGGDVKIIAA